jgi:hypothetical protein
MDWTIVGGVAYWLVASIYCCWLMYRMSSNYNARRLTLADAMLGSTLGVVLFPLLVFIDIGAHAETIVLFKER